MSFLAQQSELHVLVISCLKKSMQILTFQLLSPKNYTLTKTTEEVFKLLLFKLKRLIISQC